MKVNEGKKRIMSKEPEIFCPQCGSRAAVLIWYTDEPGTGFGSANCYRCGGIDFTVRHGRVVKSALADADQMTDAQGDLLSAEAYDRELMEYMLEQNLI